GKARSGTTSAADALHPRKGKTGSATQGDRSSGNFRFSEHREPRHQRSTAGVERNRSDAATGAFVECEDRHHRQSEEWNAADRTGGTKVRLWGVSDLAGEIRAPPLQYVANLLQGGRFLNRGEIARVAAFGERLDRAAQGFARTRLRQQVYEMYGPRTAD